MAFPKPYSKEVVKYILGKYSYHPDGFIINNGRIIYSAINKGGYKTISIKNKQCKIEQSKALMHRIIWILCHKEDCPTPIDHKDGNKINNRIENLQAVTHSQNSLNRRANKGGTSQYQSVCKKGNSWNAKLVIKGNVVFNKHFATEIGAAQARDQWIRDNVPDYEHRYFYFNFPDDASYHYMNGWAVCFDYVYPKPNLKPFVMPSIIPRTHCINGHEITPKNTRKSGSCGPCNNQVRRNKNFNGWASLIHPFLGLAICGTDCAILKIHARSCHTLIALPIH